MEGSVVVVEDVSALDEEDEDADEIRDEDGFELGVLDADEVCDEDGVELGVLDAEEAAEEVAA